ncbi:hypothetical protein [Thalassotalea castellviae]|uniref:Tetratricopeptide repeat protein n=1 Tax=Thalassotalea castellviae TaxID=3075612 RepID=A0ABU2ZWQ8_9GAMM|nr:hypothetical protein [Thalassotalea sp. W431]MDT0602364.1 hypothetical protein [Thalassotalea sp. W431]
MLRKIKIPLLLFCSLFCLYLYINFQNQPQKLQAETKSDLVIKHKNSKVEVRSDKLARPTQEKSIQKRFSNIKENEIENDNEIFDCLQQQNVLFQEETTKKEHFVNYLDNLKASNKVTDKLALLFHSPIDETKSKLQDYAALHEESPLNKLIYKEILELCNKNFDEKICNDELFNKAKLIDNDNAMFWHNIATIKLKNNKIDEAVLALKEANKKLEYSNYYYEKFEFIDSILKEQSNLNFSERFSVASIVNGASYISSLTAIVEFCKNNFFTDTNITDTCYQTSLHLENQSKNYLPYFIALELQKIYHEYYENIHMIDEVTTKITTRQNLLRNKNNQKAQSLIFFDETLASDWLKLSRDKGEIIAAEQLMKDAILYSKSPDYNPCPTL